MNVLRFIAHMLFKELGRHPGAWLRLLLNGEIPRLWRISWWLWEAERRGFTPYTRSRT